MGIDSRVLIDPQGAILGRGLKTGARDGLHRASNESRRVFEAWARFRREDRLPRLDQVYPGALGGLVGSILIVDVLAAERDYRYRIVGKLAADTRRSDPTGKTVRQIYSGEVLAFCLENYHLAAASAWGAIDFSVEVSADPRFLELETLFLPLSEDGDKVTEILVYGHYVER